MDEAIEGRNAVLEALKSGRGLRRVLVAEGVRPDRTIDDIRRLAAKSGVRVETVPRQVLDEASARGAHQGVLAWAEPFSFTPIERVLAVTEGRRRSLVIVLDHITDPGNLGAVVRSAEVAGADAVVMAKSRSAPVTQVTHKTSAGATSWVPIVRVPNLVRSLGQLKEAGYWVAGASEHAEQTIWDAPMEGRLAIVLGSEGEGLARLTERSCDFLVRIPLSGKVSSLNVAQAATVLAFEWVRRGAAEEA